MLLGEIPASNRGSLERWCLYMSLVLAMNQKLATTVHTSCYGYRGHRNDVGKFCMRELMSMRVGW